AEQSNSQPSPERMTRPITPARVDPSGREGSEPAHALLQPRRGSNATLPSADSARAVAANPDVKTPSESRSIQVKIGRVEIRSSQPALPVVRTPRTAGTSGFEDLRLARTYLDRGAR